MEQDNQHLRIDFAGIGAPRCGTTWLAECLREHPGVELLPKDQRQWNLFFNGTDRQKWQAAESYFKKQGAIKGDYNVNYFYEDPEIPKNIKNHNPDAKIIAVLRDPVERAFSQYRYTRFSHNKSWQSFEGAKQEMPELILEPGFYYKYLEPYYRAFSSDNILVLLYDRDIKNQPLAALSRVYAFLGVNSTFVSGVAKARVNASGLKETTVGRLVHKYLMPFLDRLKIGHLLRRGGPFKRLYYSIFGQSGKKEGLAGEALSELRELYREDVRNLEKLIGEDLNKWK